MQKVENVSLLKFDFHRNRRLLTPLDYRFVFSKNKRFFQNGFVLFARPNTCGHARLGLAIAKKQISRSVHRNQIKRMIRESFRKADLPAVDLVIQSRSVVLEGDKQAWEQSLQKLWRNLGSYYGSC